MHTHGANSLLVGHARLPHRLSHVLTLALRTLVRAQLRLADLERTLLLANLQQLHAPLLIRRVSNNLPHNIPDELDALLDPALVHADAQVGLGLPNGVTGEARHASLSRHSSG